MRGILTTSECSHDGAKIVNGNDPTLVGGVCDGAIREADADFCDVVGTGIDLRLDISSRFPRILTS